MINYDFIGKCDTLKSDAARALELLGASDVAMFPDKREKLKTWILKRLYFYSGAPAAQRAARRSPITVWEAKGNL